MHRSGPGEVQLGIVQVGLGCIYLSLARRLLGNIRVQLLLRDGVLSRQWSIARDVVVGFRKACLSYLDMGLDLFDCGLILTRIEFKQQLTLLTKEPFW